MHNAWDQFCGTAGGLGSQPAILRGGERISFADWHAMAVACGGRLLDAGLRRQGRVLLWMDNTPCLAAVVTGTWAAGGIPAILDANTPPSHLQHVVETIQPQLIVRADGATLPQVELPTAVLVAEAITKPTSASAKPSDALPNEPASIVFTSGSTGKPKGVVQSHGNLLRASRTVAGYLGLTTADRILCPVPWSFDYGYGQLLSTALHGVTQIVPMVPSPFAVIEAIDRHRPSVFAGIPSWFTYLLRGLAPFKDADLSSLRLVTNTGGTIPRPIIEDMLDVFDQCQIVLNYGLTETYRTCYLDPSLVQDHADSIGRPIPGVEVAVVRDDRTLAEPGETGELVHRGDYICMGYWNDPVSTDRALRPDPLADSSCPHMPKALFTGDLGTRDERGLLYYLGRRDHQLKSMGVRVSPTEIERLLVDSELVREAAVFGVPHQLIGDEIWACVVPADAPSDRLEQEIRQYARESMSTYMSPQRYLIVEAIPKTTSGKHDYPALQELAKASASSDVWC